MSNYVPINKTYAPAEGRLFVEEAIKFYRRHGLILLSKDATLSSRFVIVPFRTSRLLEDRMRTALIEVKEVNDE